MAKLGRANILIAAVQVPFTRGGAEILVDCLRRELAAREHTVDIVQLPFNAQPKEQLLKHTALWRALDLRSFNGRPVDLVICTKFPSYMLLHPRKVLWLVHQHRQIYDLYGSRFGDFTAELHDETLRQMLVEADQCALRECSPRYTISGNVSARLERYLGIDSQPLLPPLPLAGRYRRGERGDYILSVGRICSIKRVDLMVKAMAQAADGLRLKIVGLPDEPAVETYLQSEIDKHHLWHRVEFLGRVSDEDLIDLYAGALAVYYAPYDEDYGFVTLEAFASGKPVITASDSGGVLEFVRDEFNGLIVEPNEQAIARAANRMFQDAELYAALCDNAAKLEQTNWDDVIAALIEPLERRGKAARANGSGVRAAGEA